MNQSESQNHEELVLYGDPGIASFDKEVPKFLLVTYIVLPIWGIICLTLFWNGSLGWFDRGYWHELQVAANTTYPSKNIYGVLEEKKLNEEKPSQDQ